MHDLAISHIYYIYKLLIFCALGRSQMESSAFDWGLFWPGIEALFSFEFGTTDGITNLFILVIISLFSVWLLTYFFLFWLPNFIKIYKLCKKLRKANINSSNALEYREEFRSIHSLCQQYDDTLTEHNNKLYSNYDADTFFNGKTLSPNISHSKIFPLGAVLLTGTGVLGTFVGLQYGIGSLHLNGDIAQMQDEIRVLAQSASTAFVTSVWGVFTSLLLNLAEKILSSSIQVRINGLQTQIDTIFPRFPVMDVFVDIQKDTRQSTNTMNGLAEQIGNKMQTSLDSFSQNILSSMSANINDAASLISSSIGTTLSQTIEKSLAPSINKISDASVSLAEKQANSASDTMGALIGEFIGKIGQAGEDQKQSLHNVSQEIQQSLGTFNASMANFLVQLQEQQRNQTNEQDERNATLNAAMRVLAEEQESRSRHMEEQAQSVFSQQKESLQQIASSMSQHINATKTLLEQSGSLQEKIQHDNKDLDKLTNKIEQASSLFAKASTELQSFGLSMNGAVVSNAESVKNSLRIASDLAHEHSAVGEQLQQTLSTIASLKEGFVETSKRMEGNAEQARTAFLALSEHYATLQATMREHMHEMKNDSTETIQKLDEHMSKLLSDYGDLVNAQVSDRMSKWDQETSNFCNNMVTIVQVIGEVVDSLDSRPAHR